MTFDLVGTLLKSAFSDFQSVSSIGIPRVNQLAGKIVAITGGGTGIGASIATSLAQAGCRVTVGGRRMEPLESLAVGVSCEHVIRTHRLDVTDSDSIKKFFADVQENVGAPDILVNSAGINIPNRRMDTMDPEDWDRVLQTNASGTYRCMLEVLPGMRERMDGLIVNISSVAGKRAIPLGGVVYCASKFAMTALGTAVSNEVRNEGVRITNVYPREVNTPILDNRPTPLSQEHKDSILQPGAIAAIVTTISALPPRANVPEVVIKPTTQEWL